MNSLVRQLKLHGLLGDKATTDPRIPLIIDFFIELFHGIHICNIPDYDRDSVIFHKGDKFYMEQDIDDGWLWCRADGYWEVFVKDFGFGYDDIRDIIKYMVEKHIRHLVGTPGGTSMIYDELVVNYLNGPSWKIHTIAPWSESHNDVIEKHLK